MKGKTASRTETRKDALFVKLKYLLLAYSNLSGKVQATPYRCTERRHHSKSPARSFFASLRSFGYRDVIGWIRYGLTSLVCVIAFAVYA